MELTKTERKMLEMLRKADAVFIHQDDGLKQFSWLKGFGISVAPCRVSVKYGYRDGERMVRRLKIDMGVTQKEFDRMLRPEREEE